MLQNEMIKYGAAGVCIAIADKTLVLLTNGELKKREEKQEYLNALETVVETYKKENFEELKADPRFQDAFVKTKEYLGKRGGLEFISESKDIKGPGLLKRVTTKEYWMGEKINSLPLSYKAVGSLLVPLIFDAQYFVGGAKYGTATFSDGMKELGETPFEAAGLLAGLYVGKILMKPFDMLFFKKYDKKIAKYEGRIAMNQDLKDALSNADIALPKIPVEEKPAEPEIKSEASAVPKKPAKAAPLTQDEKAKAIADENADLVARMNSLSGGN